MLGLLSVQGASSKLFYRGKLKIVKLLEDTCLIIQGFQGVNSFFFFLEVNFLFLESLQGQTKSFYDFNWDKQNF